MKRYILLTGFALAMTGDLSLAQDYSTVLKLLDRMDTRISSIDKKHGRQIAGLKAEIGKGSSSDETVQVQGRVDSLAEKMEVLEKKSDSNVEDLRMASNEFRQISSELKGVIQGAPAKESAMKAKVPTSVFKPELKGFFLYNYDASESAEGSNEFDISRVYVGGKYKLSDAFTARYRTDIGHESKTGKFEVFTKYAYLDWTYKPLHASFIVGLQGTQNWKASEKQWGYRVIQKAPFETFAGVWDKSKKAYVKALESRIESLRDTSEGGASSSNLEKADGIQLSLDNFMESSKAKMGSSADMGIGGSFKISESTYAKVLLYNGSGYKKIEDDRFKNFQVRAGKFFLGKAFHISGLINLEPWEGKDATGTDKTFFNYHWNAFVGYTASKKFSVGFDVNSKVFRGEVSDLTAWSYSAFGRYSLVPGVLGALARYDIYDTGIDEHAKNAGLNLKSDSRFLILGLDYAPHKLVKIIPNWQYLEYEETSKEASSQIALHLQLKL